MSDLRKVHKKGFLQACEMEQEVMVEIIYWLAIIGLCIIVGFGVYYISNFIEVQIIKSNCDQMGGNLTYEGHQSNWLFVTDIWSCKTEKKSCFSNGTQINCSNIEDLADIEKNMEDIKNILKWQTKY